MSARVVAVGSLAQDLLTSLRAKVSDARSPAEMQFIALFGPLQDEIGSLVQIAREEMGAAAVRVLQTADGA